jgi:cation diffusion facilitator family transporter
MKKPLSNQRIRRITLWSMSINLSLFIGKLIVALLINSVALISDAFNHFSDSLSGVIFWIGQKLSNRQADANHPQGHGRGEYLTSLSIGVLMLVVSAQFLIESIRRLINPSSVETSVWAYAVLLVAIFTKLGLFVYTNYLYKQTKLLSTKAIAIDNFFDILISSLVFISLLVQPFFSFSVDGVAGLIISILLGWNAWQILLQSVRRVLGEALNETEIENIRLYLKSYPDVLGSHLFVFHDYGPHYQMLNFHLEVASTQSLIKMHDLVDELEETMKQKWGYEVTIHLDPLVTDVAEIEKMTKPILTSLKRVNLDTQIQDIRMIKEKLHQEMIVVVKESKQIDDVRRLLLKQFPNFRFVFESGKTNFDKIKL